MKKPFGIDIGSTYSKIAIYNVQRGPRMVKDKYARSAIPSIVSYSDRDHILQGSNAETCIKRNSSSTIYDTKRMIGQRYSSNIINSMKNNWSFKVEKDEKDDGILIDIPTQHKKLRPYEVTAELLKYLITIGNYTLPKKLQNRNAVITVPANFSEVQREEIIKAAELAEITTLRLLSEPTAVGIACAYIYDLFSGNDSSTVLIYDFGGYALNVTLLKVDKNNQKNNFVFMIKAFECDTHLGGHDFDEVLLNYIIEKFKLDKNNHNLMETARKSIINAKIVLSVQEKALIMIEYNDDVICDMVITRNDFEKISQHLIQRCLLPVQRLLKNNNIEKSVVDNIILSGGSSRLPFVNKILAEYFEKEPFCGIDPQESVALGASIFAYKIMNNKNSIDEDRRDDIIEQKQVNDNDEINKLKEENTALNCKVQQLEEKVKKLTNESKTYKNYFWSMKEKSSELTFYDQNEYEDVSIIGEGATLSVKIVHKKEKYAKKELLLFDHKSMQRFLGECEILFILRHPCIIRVYGFNYGDATHKPSIILSLEPKSLETAIKNKELNFEEKNRITVELVLGMRYIHRHRFMHRDLKPLNILLSKNNHVRITDFGLAKEEDLSTSQTKGVGTLLFMAPERFNTEEEEENGTRYTNKVDVYSFGIILIFIVNDKYPTFNLKKVVTGVLPKLPENISKWVRELIISCLSFEPGNRPSFAEIFEIMKKNNFDLFSDNDDQKKLVKLKTKQNIEARIMKIEAFEFQHQ